MNELERYNLKRYIWIIIILIPISLASIYLFELVSQEFQSTFGLLDRIKEGLIYYLYHS